MIQKVQIIKNDIYMFSVLKFEILKFKAILKMI